MHYAQANSCMGLQIQSAYTVFDKLQHCTELLSVQYMSIVKSIIYVL